MQKARIQTILGGSCVSPQQTGWAQRATEAAAVALAVLAIGAGFAKLNCDIARGTRDPAGKYLDVTSITGAIALYCASAFPNSNWWDQCHALQSRHPR